MNGVLEFGAVEGSNAVMGNIRSDYAKHSYSTILFPYLYYRAS